MDLRPDGGGPTTSGGWDVIEMVDHQRGRVGVRGVQMLASEDVRNRVLRRADWRFLLPAPRPETTILYADGALGEAVRAVSERVLDGCHGRPPEDCDLAVAVDPDDATLRAAWAGLRPGGCCYTEWSARGLRPVNIRSRLRRAGFRGVTCFVPRPDPDDAAPQAWIPLGAAAARRWYLRRTRGAPGLRSALRSVRQQLGWRLANWCRLPSVLCVVARKPPGPAFGDGCETLADDFRAPLWRAIRTEGPADDTGHAPEPPWVLLTQGAHSLNKIVLVVLKPDGSPDTSSSCREPRRRRMRLVGKPRFSKGFGRSVDVFPACRVSSSQAHPQGFGWSSKRRFMERLCPASCTVPITAPWR